MDKNRFLLTQLNPQSAIKMWSNIMHRTNQINYNSHCECFVMCENISNNFTKLQAVLFPWIHWLCYKNCHLNVTWWNWTWRSAKHTSCRIRHHFLWNSRFSKQLVWTGTCACIFHYKQRPTLHNENFVNWKNASCCTCLFIQRRY